MMGRCIAVWKDIEYVMCDSNGTCITVCNMENLDLVGVHTDDSISIYLAQSLLEKIQKVIVDYTGKLACSLNVIWLINI